jgi:putative copper export protein
MPMVLRDLMRTAHVLAGGVWVGGSVMYLLVIGPTLKLGRTGPEVGAMLGQLFRRLVNLCIGILLLSGVYLIFDRLSSVEVGTAYIVVLVVKVAAALAMFALALYQAQEARRLAKRRGRLWRATPRVILGLGILTVLLGAALTTLYEAALAPGIR